MKAMLMKYSVENLLPETMLKRRTTCSFTLEPADECPDNTHYGKTYVCPFTLESCLESGIAEKMN